MRKCVLLVAFGVSGLACSRAERAPEPAAVVVIKGNAEQQQAVGGLLAGEQEARMLKVMPQSQAQTWSLPSSSVRQFEQLLQSRGYAYAEALPPGVTTLVADHSLQPDQVSAEARRIIQEFAGDVPYRISDDRPERVTFDLYTEAVAVNQVLRLRLPDGSDVQLRRPTEGTATQLDWIAVSGADRGEAMIVVTEQGVTGTITLPRAQYSILPLPGGQQLIFQSDRRTAPPDHPPSSPSGGRRQVSALVNPMADAPPGTETGCPAPQRTVDILTVYTPAARALLKDVVGSAKLAFGEAQKSLVNSGLSQVTFRHVGIEEIPLQEDLSVFENNLKALVAAGEKPGHTVHALRTQRAADLVVMIVANSKSAGLAEQIHAGRATAYAAVSMKWMIGPQYTFSHEIGHLFGARHDPATDPDTTPFPFGHGYIDPKHEWRTIMAYDRCGGCRRVPHWANTSVKYAYNGAARETGALPNSNDSQVFVHSASRVSQFHCAAQ